MTKQQQTRSSTGSASSPHLSVTASMRKKFCLREFFFFFYHLSRLGLAVALVILGSQSSLLAVTLHPGYARVQEILQLWHKDVIVDMVTVNTYNCPAGYEPYTSAQWEGTREGCLCRTMLGTYDYVHVIPGECTSKLIAVGCTRVPAQQGLPFVFWAPDQLLCLKRIKGLNFYTNLQEDLQIQQRQTCAQGTPYEFESLATQSCPVTALANDTISNPDILREIGFSYSRESSYPICDIKMSQYSFCQQYNLSNISPDRFQNYDLELVERRNCPEDSDPRVRVVDSITEKQLFLNNQRIFEIVTEKLPIYPEPTDDYMYLLGSVEYPAWTRQCRASQQFSLREAKPRFQFKEAVEKSQVCIYLSVFLVSIWGVAYSVVLLVRHGLELRHRHQHKIMYFPDELVAISYPNLINNSLRLSLFSELSVLVLLLGLALGYLIQLGVQYKYVAEVEEWLRTSFACMDGRVYFQAWVEQGYLGQMQFVLRRYLMCILAGLIVACLDGLFMVWRCSKGDLRAQKIGAMSQDGDKNSDEEISNVNLGNETVFDKEFDLEDSKVHNQFNGNQQSSIGLGSPGKHDSFRKTAGKIFRISKNAARTRAVREQMNPTEENLAHVENEDFVLEDQRQPVEFPMAKKSKKSHSRSRSRILDFEIQQI